MSAAAPTRRVIVYLRSCTVDVLLSACSKTSLTSPFPGANQLVRTPLPHANPGCFNVVRTTIAGNFDRTVEHHLGREDAELYLMRLCRHAIMANSSYSWWGGWLGADIKAGMVIAPKNWFGPAFKEDPRDIVPGRWIRL